MPLAALKLGPDFTKGMVLGKLRRLALAEASQLRFGALHKDATVAA